MNISIFWEYFHRFIIFYLLWLLFLTLWNIYLLFLLKFLLGSFFLRNVFDEWGLELKGGFGDGHSFMGGPCHDDNVIRVFHENVFFFNLFCVLMMSRKSFITCFHCQFLFVRGESCEAWKCRWKGWNSNRGPAGHCKWGLWKNMNNINNNLNDKNDE